MFQRLCGVNALQNVILVTTMWSEIEDPLGSFHEMELHAKYWDSMIKVGSRSLRFDYTHESAWAIVDQLNGTPRPLQLQRELVDERKPLAYTAAGSALFQWLENLISQLRDLVLKLEARLRGKSKAYGGGELAKEATATKERLREVKQQRNKLEIPRSTSPEPMAGPSRLGLHRSESTWSLTSLPSATDENNRPDIPRVGNLVATIAVLRHAQNMANMTPFAPLKGAVGLALAIAESVEVQPDV